jgi:hypothetical protein
VFTLVRYILPALSRVDDPVEAGGA